MCRTSSEPFTPSSPALPPLSYPGSLPRSPCLEHLSPCSRLNSCSRVKHGREGDETTTITTTTTTTTTTLDDATRCTTTSHYVTNTTTYLYARSPSHYHDRLPNVTSLRIAIEVAFVGMDSATLQRACERFRPRIESFKLIYRIIVLYRNLSSAM
ncbi:hypothetical protein ALC53_02665 [Atta colombica]|uniref:Uncharacterized protein n=1 Tax=Atta colombica TaxID=520822 RepID=A0A195BRQ0_9HYME|nr:hypothetical protein ALC53_02665 [Atta colombica]